MFLKALFAGDLDSDELVTGLLRCVRVSFALKDGNKHVNLFLLENINYSYSLCVIDMSIVFALIFCQIVAFGAHFFIVHFEYVSGQSFRSSCLIIA